MHFVEKKNRVLKILALYSVTQWKIERSRYKEIEQAGVQSTFASKYIPYIISFFLIHQPYATIIRARRIHFGYETHRSDSGKPTKLISKLSVERKAKTRIQASDREQDKNHIRKSHFNFFQENCFSIGERGRARRTLYDTFHTHQAT